MNWFIAGVAVLGIAVLLVVGNAMYDIYTEAGADNRSLNTLGVVMGCVILIAFALRSSGHPMIANAILWIPASVLIIVLLFFLFYLIVSYLSGGGWQ